MTTSLSKRAFKIKATGEIIPVGTKVTIEFIKLGEHSIDAMRVTLPDGRQINTRSWSTFFKAPSINTLEKWSFDAVAKSVTGKRTEPDGHGEDGSPSWLLALGYI